MGSVNVCVWARGGVVISGWRVYVCAQEAAEVQLLRMVAGISGGGSPQCQKHLLHFTFTESPAKSVRPLSPLYR